VTVHDLLVDVARSVIDGTVGTSEVTKKRFCRWVGKPREQPPSAQGIEHLVVNPLNSANFPHALFSCSPRVVSFVATHSQTLTLPDLAPGLRNCRLLVIAGTNTHWSPSGLEGLPHMQVVNLDSGIESNYYSFPRGGLRSFPTSLRSLSHVELVDQPVLGTLDLTDLDPQGLLELRLRYCDSLTSLQTRSLVKLQRLEIVGCQLVFLPTTIFNCSSELTYVRLSNCSALKSLPTELSSLLNLSVLLLDGCSALESLPTKVSSLTKLSRLSLRHCEALRNVPDSIGSLKALEHLNMFGCRSVQELPPSMQMLSSLERLDLTFC
jgi:hypothetical protein